MTSAYDIWGAAALGLVRPNGPLAYGVLTLAVALLLGLLYRLRAPGVLRAMSRGQWALFAALCVAAFAIGQLFPLSWPWASPLLRAHPATAYLLLFSTVAWLIAGSALNVPAAMVVGLFAGCGRALAQTGSPVDVAATALAAGLAAWLMQQNYTGRIFRLARQPIAAAVAGQGILVIFTGLEVFAAAATRAGRLGALDLALFLGTHSAAPLLFEGLVGGLLLTFSLWIIPEWRASRGLVPSPLRRSLRRQLAAAFLSFAAVVFLLSALLAFALSQRAASQAIAEQMAANADAVAVRLGAFQSSAVNTLAQYGADPALADSDFGLRRAALGRLQRSSPQFSQIKLVSETAVTSSEPGSATLSTPERTLVAAAVEAGAARFGIEAAAGGEQVVTIAVPRQATSGDPVVLLGRIAPAALAAVVTDLPLAGGASGGAVLDEQSRVIHTTGTLVDAGLWETPHAEEAVAYLRDARGRAVYARLDPATGARQLVYYTLVPESGWKVVTIVPQARILRQALGVMTPLAGLLLVISTLFFLYVAELGRAITRPVAEISQASRAIAVGGGLERPVRGHREDEIGQLTLAFSQMQRALRQRLDELSLLLSVSNEVAATVNLSEGMTAVLQGILRGTGAAGARAVIRNPVGSAPLVFGEGPAAESLAPLDRAVVRRMRAVDELGLATPQEIQSELEHAAPVAAIFALPLRLAGEYQGALYLGYRQPHYFDSDERNLLRTLAGQAAVLVQNAYLFAAAEGGRRRLSAILTSTTNAVIVTDQTDRVLLLNPAMERALDVAAVEVAGRPVADALGRGEWVELGARLTTSNAATDPAAGKLEVGAGGRDYLASISIVHNSDGLAIGRVAVLQDVTDLKAVDRLKTDFIDGISHDLRSPLTYMRTYAGMLPVIDDPALEREYVSKIHVGIERMSRLVDDLLDMTRIRAGIDLQFDRVNVEELLTELAQEYMTTARLAGIRLAVDAPRDLPPVKADPNQLRRALTNLLINALAYAPNSGPVTLRAEQRGRELVLSVSDHGPGIAPADLPHLFQKFYRGKQSAAERSRGSGLGLAIVKSIADQHSGRVWCESAPGQGSIFFLALPIEAH